MRTVTFKSVVDGVFALAGVTRTTAADPTALLEQVIGHVNLRVREAWEFEFWPELCPVEQRYYRAEWDAGDTYAAADEVWFPNDDEDLEGYYSANAAPDTPTAGQSPETHPAKWTELTTFRRYVALDQTGETAIGEVIALYKTDPRLTGGRAARIRHTLTAEGVAPVGWCGNYVWAHFRTRPPAYSAANYASETPTDFPIPYVLASFVQRAAFADFLRQDSKFEEGGRAEAQARKDLLDAADAAGASQGQFPSAGVCTY